MKIGILQCGHALPEVKAAHGDYAAMFRRLLDGHDFTFTSHDVVDMDIPADIHACDGWLLTGSPHGVYDDLPFIAPLEDFVRRAHAGGVPLVGICFGHQLIAQALGGKVEKFRKGWSVGSHRYHFEGVGEVSLNAWHQDQVVTPPPGAETIASSPFCAHAGLAYGDRALTIQAHPEFSNAVIADLIRLRRGTGSYPDDLMDAAQGHLSTLPDSPGLGARIAAFFLSHDPAAKARKHG